MAAETEANAPVGEVAEVADERALFLFGQTFRSVTGPPFRPVALDSWVEPWLGGQSPRDPGFMNPTGAPEP